MSENKTKGAGAELAMRALYDTPSPTPEPKQIVALEKQSGRVTGYQLSDGRTLNKEEGVMLARQGEIKGVGVASRNGNEYLKSLPDGTENNNLSNLPSVKN